MGLINSQDAYSAGLFRSSGLLDLPDELVLRAAGPGNDTINGNNNNNSLSGLGGNDVIRGNGGIDDLYGGTGADKLYGGDQSDGLDGGAGNDSLYGGKGVDLIGGFNGKDVVFGGAGADGLDGRSKADRLSGDGGNDTLVGGTGADQFMFKANHGNDTITDFENNVDKIRIESAVNININIDYSGPNALVTVGELGITILVENVANNSLQLSQQGNVFFLT